MSAQPPSERVPLQGVVCDDRPTAEITALGWTDCALIVRAVEGERRS
jgi:hypothetical protein